MFPHIFRFTNKFRILHEFPEDLSKISLVGGFNHLEKQESQLGRIIPYMKWTIKAMFQTTNQLQLKPSTRSGFPIAMFEATSNYVKVISHYISHYIILYPHSN